MKFSTPLQPLPTITKKKRKLQQLLHSKPIIDAKITNNQGTGSTVQPRSQIFDIQATLLQAEIVCQAVRKLTNNNRKNIPQLQNITECVAECKLNGKENHPSTVHKHLQDKQKQ